MNERTLALSIKDILDEYRILEDTPLKKIALITVKDNKPLFCPIVEIHMNDGVIYDLIIEQKGISQKK